MYITQEIAERVKSQAKQKKISIKNLLMQCELNVNTISDFSRGQQISLISFARIADVLNCSIDYFLGRTDNPMAHKSVSSMTIGDVSGNSGAIGVGNMVTNSAASLDEYQTRLLELFDELTIDERTELLGDLKIKLTKKDAQKNDDLDYEENSKDNSFLCQPSKPIFCPKCNFKTNIIIHLNRKDEDTIIGYDCDYPHCHSSTCKLPKLYPVGTSIIEAIKKLK